MTKLKNENKKIKAVLGHLFWDQEELFSEKNQHQKSLDTAPLIIFKNKNLPFALSFLYIYILVAETRGMSMYPDSRLAGKQNW